MMEVKNSLEKLLQNQKYMVLASLNVEGIVCTNLVAFDVDESFENIHFITSKNTRKYANILSNHQVSAYIDNRNNDSMDITNIIGVNATGRAKELDKKKYSDVLRKFKLKMPFLEPFIYSNSNALIRVSVQYFDVVTRFQEVVCIEINSDDK